MIDILLASFNGEKYIEEQINSILGQTYNEWRLLIRDDDSRDSTPEIINKYCEKYPNKIVRLVDKKGNLGYKNNFIELMKHASSDYIMFCDQDDIWLPDKIEKTYNYMKTVEAENNDKPVIVHTNLHIYHEGKELVRTYHKKGIKSSYNLRRAIMFSNVVECTAMLNGFYKEIDWGQEFDASHGYFLTLYCLSHGGTIAYLDVPTILYRQHDNNQIGESINSQPLLKIKKLLDIRKYAAGIKRTKDYREKHDAFVSSFVSFYYAQMTDDAKKIFYEQSSIKQKSGLRCIVELKKKGYLEGDWYTVLVTCLYYLFWRGENIND